MDRRHAHADSDKVGRLLDCVPMDMRTDVVLVLKVHLQEAPVMAAAALPSQFDGPFLLQEILWLVSPSPSPVFSLLILARALPSLFTAALSVPSVAL